MYTHNYVHICIHACILYSMDVHVLIHYMLLQIPSLVCGPFGCGKTRTLRECIVLMLLHQPSAKMLICTHSNSAADLYVEDISKEWNSKFVYMYVHVYV